MTGLMIRTAVQRRRSDAAAHPRHRQTSPRDFERRPLRVLRARLWRLQMLDGDFVSRHLFHSFNFHPLINAWRYLKYETILGFGGIKSQKLASFGYRCSQIWKFRKLTMVLVSINTIQMPTFSDFCPLFSFVLPKYTWGHQSQFKELCEGGLEFVRVV